MSEDGAARKLAAQGFRLGPSKRAWSTEDSGTVATTDPKPGATLSHGATVSLVLSRGAQPASVPAVKGDTVAAATATVTAARLTLGQQVERTSSRAAGTVLRLIDADGDTVPAAAEVPAGTTVRLVVSTGPTAPPTTP